jgi:hypothetical protein
MYSHTPGRGPAAPPPSRLTPSAVPCPLNSTRHAGAGWSSSARRRGESAEGGPSSAKIATEGPKEAAASS